MEKLSIFVSRPNDLTPAQNTTWNRIDAFLRQRGLIPRTIGTTDFPNTSPLAGVAQVMQSCHGAMILGFHQTLIRDGALKVGTSSEQHIANAFLATPWNHIEAGMAYQLRLPLLIVREVGISGGVFDIGSVEGYIHQFDLSTTSWIEDERFLQPFAHWYSEVLRHADGVAE